MPMKPKNRFASTAKIKLTNPRPRGFAAMDPDKQRKIAKKGGQTLASKNPSHMKKIGKKGGLKSWASRCGNIS